MKTSAAPILQIFAREPTAGAVKTRLAAVVGAERAAAAYRALTEVTMQQAARAQALGIVAAVELWCTPVADSPWFQTCAATATASLHLQPAGDLGSRMRAALLDGLTRADAVLLIGTDCPVLDVPDMAAAAALLATHDAVLILAEDGGFVLVGARVPLTFEDVRMSTQHAAMDTLAAFDRASIRCGLLSALWDVDEIADLERWHRLLSAARTTTP